MKHPMLQLLQTAYGYRWFAYGDDQKQNAIDLEDQGLVVTHQTFIRVTPLGAIFLQAYRVKDKSVRCEILNALYELDDNFVGFDWQETYED